MCTSGCFQNGNNHFFFPFTLKYIKSFYKNDIPIALFKILMYILGVLKFRGWNAGCVCR